MGNSVSCVRKPKEPGRGKGPHPSKRKRRFRPKKKDRGHGGEEEHQGGSQKEKSGEASKKFKAYEGGEDPRRTASPQRNPAEEGRVLQVRETLHGELQRATLLCTDHSPTSATGSQPEGTTVIAHILETGRQNTVRTVVEFGVAGSGKRRAVLLPFNMRSEKLEDAAGGAQSAGISSGTADSETISELVSPCPLMQLMEAQEFVSLSDKAITEDVVPLSQSWGLDHSSSGYCSDPTSQPVQISDIYVSGESGDMSAKEKLLLWTQKVTAGYIGVKCTNFSSCWNDGKMFNALIHRYRPDLVDLQKVEVQSNRENLEQAFEIAESLGITRLLDAEDVDVQSPDEKSVITYVSSIYDAFPKVPEGAEGINATEVDSRALEYQERVVSLTQWIRQHVLLMSDKFFPQNPVDLKALYNQYIHIKETEIPAKEQEKGQIKKLYQMLQAWIEFGRLKLPPSFHPNDVEEQWGKLILLMLEREKALRPAVEKLELLLQIANRIQNGCLSCEEKLTLARNTLQSDAAHIECGQRAQQEGDVMQFLQESEELVHRLQADVQILRDEKYFQVEELAFRVLRIQDELLTLRLEYTNLYRRGHFTTSDLQPSASLSTSHHQSLHTTPPSSTSWFRKPMSRTELVALSSSEDEGSLRFVYELLAWVEEMQMKLERAEWGSDLPTVETQLENQRQVHSSVEDLAASLREARSYESKMSQNFRSSYRETLSKLETQYCKLRETSISRLRHLQSLHSFVSRATAQIIWLNEKEEEELAYDWSDGNPNMVDKKDYFTELTQELDEKQDVIQSLQETAELLSLENHPAKQTVEAYSAAVFSQWQWVQQLCLCVEQHVKENSAYFQFFSDMRESEVYLRNLQDSIKRKYSCDRNTSVTRLEDMLQDSMDEKEELIQSKSSVASLVGRSKYIVQLKPRNPEHALSSTLPIRAICDYRQIEITISRNDECVLEDNSQRTKWKVISPTGNEAMVPSVCFLIPPPNKEAIDMANRVEQLYQKVMSLWHQLHVNTKSLISWHYLRKDVEVVQGWNVEKLRILPLGERLQTLSSLQSHFDDFLEDSRDSQLFSLSDRLHLEQEVDACREQCKQMVDLIETEDKDESVAQTYMSELHNIRLHLEQCEQRLARRIQSPAGYDGAALHENTIHISEQERMQEELKRLKSELYLVSDRCDHFLHKSPSGSSTQNLRSQLDLVVGRMDHMLGLSSVFLEKLKTVDVVVRSLQGAEALVKGFESRLSQEDTVPADPTAIQSQQAVLQQWLSEVEEKAPVFSALEEDVAKSKEVRERLYQKSQERSVDVEHYQERTAKLRERWNGVHIQLETRQSDLTGIRDVLRNYRECHNELIQWIETTKEQQEKMKPGQSEDRRVLSEQLRQQTALVAEIERNQCRLDECQTFSQHYSVSVKDYELQLMTYRAFVESQQKSPGKRRRIQSSSDAITQEFMDLRTRYTALVTLTTQHVKYISDALRKLEEEEKVLEEEKERHVEDLKQLTGWVSGLSQVVSPYGADLKKSISEQQALSEELLSKKDQVSQAVKTMQIFLAKHGDKLSAEERREISSHIQELKETYSRLCDESESHVQQLHNQLAHEAEQKEYHTVAGVMDLGSMEIFPIFWAMQKGLIDQDTGLGLLEAQVVLSGLIVPETNEKLTLEEALKRNIVDHRLFQLLQDLRDALKLVDRNKMGKEKLLSVVAAIGEKKMKESVGLKILGVNLATGGFRLTSSRDLTDLEKASQDGLLTPQLCQKLESSCKNLIDPNTAKKVSLAELLQCCIIHEYTGLRLLPVKQLAGGMVCLRSGKTVSIFSAIQERLIDRQVAVRLLEAQLFAGGIADPKTGHRLTLNEALKHHLMDQDTACALLMQQVQEGGIIDTVTGKRVTVDEAVKYNLVSPKLALLILESLGSIRGLLWPDSGEILLVADALQESFLSTELVDKIIGSKQRIQGLYVSDSKEVLSWEEAVERGILNGSVARMLQSAVIPDIMGSVTPGCVPEPGGQPASVSVNSSPHPAVDSASEEHSESQPEDYREKLMSHLMQYSYINIHDGHRLLLIDSKENAATELLSGSYKNSSSRARLDLKTMTHKECNVHEVTDLGLLTALKNGEAHVEQKADLCLPNEVYNLFLGTSDCKTDDAIASPSHTSLESQNQQITQYVTEDKTFKHPQIPLTKRPNNDAGGGFILSDVPIPSHSGIINTETLISQGAIISKEFIGNKTQLLSKAGSATSGTRVSKINKTADPSGEVLLDKENSTPEMSADTDREYRSEPDLKSADPAAKIMLNNETLAKVPKKSKYLDVKSKDPERGGVFDNVKDTDDSPCSFPSEYPFKMGEDDTLSMLSEQLRNGGIVDANSNQKLLLNEALAVGVLSSHTALRLMERHGLFAGFFDSQTCDALTIQDVIDEGLMDENLLQKVLTSEKEISGILDAQKNSLYSVQDAVNVGLVDEETAKRILEVQVVTGGIFDLKRHKRISVTLASSLDLVHPSDQDELIKLEKASKGKNTDKVTRQKLMGLQIETGGITDPKTKKALSVVQAVNQDVINREEALLFLTKQISDGGIIHHLSGMRFSVCDSLKHRLIDHDMFEDLVEIECVFLNQPVPPEMSGEDMSSSKTAAKMPLPVQHTAFSSVELATRSDSRIIPYTEFLKKCKIDVMTGQRYLEVNSLREAEDENSAFSLLDISQQAQDDSTCISERGTSRKIPLVTLQQALEEEPKVRVTADNQFLTGDLRDKVVTSIEYGAKETKRPRGLVGFKPDFVEVTRKSDPDQLRLQDCLSAELLQHHVSVMNLPITDTVSPLVFEKGDANVFQRDELIAGMNGAPEVCHEKITGTFISGVVSNLDDELKQIPELITVGLMNLSSERETKSQDETLGKELWTEAYRECVEESGVWEMTHESEALKEESSLHLTAEDSSLIHEPEHHDTYGVGDGPIVYETRPDEYSAFSAFPEERKNRTVEELQLQKQFVESDTLFQGPGDGGASISSGIISILGTHGEDSGTGKKLTVQESATQIQIPHTEVPFPSEQISVVNRPEKSDSNRMPIDHEHFTDTQDPNKLHTIQQPEKVSTGQLAEIQDQLLTTSVARDVENSITTKHSKQSDNVSFNKVTVHHDRSSVTSVLQQSDKSAFSNIIKDPGETFLDGLAQQPGEVCPDSQQLQEFHTPLLRNAGQEREIPSLSELPSQLHKSVLDGIPQEAGTSIGHKQVSGSDTTIIVGKELNKDLIQSGRDAKYNLALGSERPVIQESGRRSSNTVEKTAAGFANHKTPSNMTEVTPKDSRASCSKQTCLEHEEKLVSYLSMLRDIEVRLGPPQPVLQGAAGLHEQLRQAEMLDREVRDLVSPASRELGSVKHIVADRPREIPVQLLVALETDAKNLEKSLTSVKDASESRILQLQTALGAEKSTVLAEHKELERKLQSLLQWVGDTAGSMDSVETSNGLDHDDSNLQREHKHAEGLRQPVADTRLELDSIAFEIQFFISERAQHLTPQQSRTLLRLLNELQRSFRELSERMAARDEVLQLRLRQAKYNVEVKTLQEQQGLCTQRLEELTSWVGLTEKAVRDHQAAIGNEELSTLQDRQKSMQELLKGVQARGEQFASVIKAAEDFLDENRAKMDPKELETLQKKLQHAKEQYHAVLQRTGDTERQLDTAVSTAVQEETEKSKTAEELKVNLGRIESLLSQVLPGALPKVSHPQQRRSVTERAGYSNKVESDGCPDTNEAADLLNELCERKKTHHQEMWAQQQNCILAIQSAQAFLDKHGSSLAPEERQRLQGQLTQLKEEYAASLSQSEVQLKQVQGLRDELQKFLHDHGEFESWLQHSEQELENMQKGDGDCESLRHLLHQQADFSEDVISHKGDLRYITISGQKVVEAEKIAADQCKEDFETPVAGSLVKTKLEDASKRFSTLHSKCSKFGSHLNSLLSRHQQFQEAADATLEWLHDTESKVERILAEPVASDPEALQTQLEKAKNVQCGLAEHQVQVEKVHKALRTLLEIQGDPSPDCKSIQATTDGIESRYQGLSVRMSEHSDLLQKSVAQSQSVQDGLENLLHWLEGMEKTLENQKRTSMSSSSIQESLAMNMKLKQDIGGRRSSLDATGEMVGRFMETADSAAASALQSKLSEVTARFNTVCQQQRQQETTMKAILPKVERYEQISELLQEFNATRSRQLATGNQPDRDIAQFSQQIQDLNAEIKQQEGNLVSLEQLTKELATSTVLVDSSEHVQKVQMLKRDFLKLLGAASEREKEALSCQEDLDQFRRLVGSMRKWLKDNEESVPSAGDSLGTKDLQIRVQQVQDLLHEWKLKGGEMEKITEKGSELEVRIMEITAPESQQRGGSVLLASVSSVGNVNGYHTCQDLTSIQCDISEIGHKYEGLGQVLRNREDQLSALLKKMQEVQQEADVMLRWLESKEKAMTALNVSSTKTEAMSAQAKQNKEFLSELEQSSGKVESLKTALRDLLDKHPNSPEAATWKRMLENLNRQWDTANQVTTERQQKLEESANQLAIFQAAGSQLHPWLMEKELMMSVLGPLSIEPNMLITQKQQVQFMLKEFEARKEQYEQLKQAAFGILTGPGDECPSTSQVEEEFDKVNQKWAELTKRLNSRSNQIDQAVIKSTQYREVLQGLTDKMKLAGKKLGAQSAISTHPNAVKQQLQENSEIRSDLELLAKEVTEAQVLCDELSALMVEQYLKDELKKRLDTIALPLRGMEDLAADRVNRLQVALASSQQFQQTFDELRSWVDSKQIQQAQSSPISAKLETLQTLVQGQEEFQKSLNQNSGSYEMIVNEGGSLILSAQPGEEKITLQNQLATLKANWEELGRKAADRHSKLKDCLQKAQKYGRHVEDLVPWMEDCGAQMTGMEVTLDPVQLEALLLRAKALQSDIDKKRSLLEMMNSAADLLIDAAEVDDSDILEEKAKINQTVDRITEQLHVKAGSIEEMSLRLKELKDSFKNINKKLDGAKHLLEIYTALGPQACSSKNLENMRSQQDMLQALDAQVQYLNNLLQGLVEDAPEGSDVSQLLRQAEDVQQDFEAVKQGSIECCSAMESKLQGIGQFHTQVREMFSQLADLDDELDGMSPVGRDVDSLRSQAEVVQKFLENLKDLKLDIEGSEKKCLDMLENEGGPDLVGLKRELGTLNKQCSKLTERGKNRQEQLEASLARVDEFCKKQKELKHQIMSAEGSSALQGVVGAEVDSIKQQLGEFRVFQKEHVDPLQVRLQQVNGLGQGLIQSAEKNCDVHGLEHDTEELNMRWNTLNKKVAERVTQLQEALLHCGKFQDALEPLLSWLTDTEDLIANQKPPSAEYKVVKAQIQEQKLLQRLLDDRKATVGMIQAEGGRIAEGADPADREKISRQLEILEERWSSLLQKAQSRQKQLDDILVLAKQFHETTEPIYDWITATEKKLANSEPIGTQTGKIQQQISRHKSLEDDITVRETGVLQAGRFGDSLAALCAAAERVRLAERLDMLQARYSDIQDHCCRKSALLEQALSNARLFGEDEMEVLNWLSVVEDKLSSESVKDYKLEVLQKQHTHLMALSEDILNRKRNVDQAVKNGQALLKQTTGEEVLLIQEKLDGIKTRYSEITASSGKALRTLEQALQLASKFQSTHEELTGWLRRVEGELAHRTTLSPVGDQIPQFQQRQKELKKEVMEYRLVLDTINEVSSALLELVPWRAREGLDKLVSDANEQYRSVSSTVGQRVNEIDAAIQRSQQYEQAADAELAWVAETKRKLLALGPVCLEQDQTTAQLQVQKAFSVDIIRHKDSIDELLGTQEEILRTCGDGQKATLQEKTKSLLEQYEGVSHLHSERYARLERAQVLVNQFWETYEELNPWIEETQILISQLPPPAVDHELLRQQQEDMRQLRESIAEHKPHIDKLLKIGPYLCDLNPEEGIAVQEKYSNAEHLYIGIKEEVRQRAMALDDAIAQAVQFHDKIEPMLETLESLASRLRIPPLIPAEVEKIRDCISDNKNTLMEREKLQPSFQALKHRGEELISRSQGADKDPAAKAVQDKLDQMVFFWGDIKARADEREMKFLDVLELAEKFWLDMTALLTTIKDTHDFVHDLESPGIDPSMIKQQIEAADTIKEETDGLQEELEFLRILGADLIFACGETEKPEVKKSIDEMNSAWENLKKTWSERLEKLRDAMSTAVQYQDTLQAMFDWLDNAVIKLCDMPPVGTDLNTVKEQLNEMKEFKMEVYQQQIEMEKLNHQGELMLKKAIDDTDRDIIYGPLTELRHLWENLGEKIAHRQHKLEAALLALGQFQHALAEVMSWLTHTDEMLDAQRPISGDPKVIEVELAKHHVLKNDVLAHQSTVQTVNQAGRELLESSAGDDVNSLHSRLQTLNQSWESVIQKTEDREQLLQMALQKAQGFSGEIEDFLQWQSRIESQLSAAKATGGLPETAREQLQAHMELYAELKANEDLYKQLLDKGHLMLLSRDDASGSITEQNVALLKRKWQTISNKVEERKVKLEEALILAIDFQNSLQEFINWLTQAEQSLNIAPFPSLILDTVLFQIDEHKIFVNEVNDHREQIIELDKTGNQLKFLSQKQDVVLIKNLLLSVQSRWEKVVQRSVERGRSLDDARKRAKQFHEAWKKLVDWLEDAENCLDSELEISNDPDRIKLQLTKHKEFQKTLGSKQPVYDTTARTGRALKEKASLSDDAQKLDHLLGEVRDKWDTVCGKSVERQHKLEEALLFSGQFMDALQALVDWLYKVEPQLAEDQPVHGDLDLVMNLMDAHKAFQKELRKRTSSVQALKRSARELIDNSRDDTTWVKAQLQELSTRWDTVCKLSVSKQARLEQALKQAEEFHTTVHMLLEWLSEAEQTLRFRGALPDDAESLQSLIDVHKEFMNKVEEKQVDVNTAVSMGEGILTVCHPDCITTIKHWITIIRARFEEVLTWGNQHQQRLQAALSELVANSELLDKLLSWIQWAETTLIQRDQEPTSQNIDQVKALICEHQMFMEEMTQKQPDVDKVTKTYKRKATDPNHAAFNDKSRSRKPTTQTVAPVLPLLSQSETKNPRINQLSARWQQVWLLALERQRKLNDALDRLEELKEFANFDFDIWRKKYMRWMNHKKSRVMDFFRRIDKDQDGKITRQEFIDGILASKFPTTKLEMTAVADIFDGDGDGYIDYYEFVAALHPNKDAYRPTTDADKIEDEVTRQVAQCKCAKRFQVEQIGENKYRFFLGNQFGDSQQLRLVRILRSTVMVRVGGGWMALDEFLVKNDPCRARGRTNLELREKFILPEGVSQGMTPFRSRGRRSKPSSRTASPTRSSSSASQSNHSCTSVPSSPATPASGSKTPQHPSRCYEKPWLVNSKAGNPLRGYDYSDFQIPSCEVTPPQSSKLKKPTLHSSRTSLAGDTSTPISSGAKSNRADPKKSASRAGSRAGSRTSSRRGSDASDFDLLETQSACSDTSENSTAGGGGSSRRGLSKPSKIPTMSKKPSTTNLPKTPGTKR
ncbi:microtubule-actin cross-linking factor 1 isoform X5 [Ascaphus truei]|uniref:microtubule-actin cross-linking factor 1 isoform X5 n=1 Tax=Ascaphus truei TaxID=8439 RepID=UPI003F5A1B24